ncbi:MAG: efflux RND transporter periplasmic adaptor subunit [Deltaproteobacteria bacterium]|nr:efflux RND transporter periplasmic adaptor subunit [Deltaproteobacteria bacterium]
MRYVALALAAFLAFAAGGRAQDLVVREAYQDATLSGYTRADTTITLSAEVSGRVVAANYDMGDRVGEGPFYEIDDTFITFQVRAAKAALEATEAALNRAKSMEAYLHKEYLRIEKLHEGDRASEVKRDAAKQEWEQARLQIQALSAEKKAREVDLARLVEQRARYDVYAPIGYTVVHRLVEPGEVVNPQVPLARVGDFNTLVVPMCLTSQELAAVRALGETFEANLEGQTATVSIYRVNPEFNETTRKRCLELLIQDYPGERLGGLKLSFAVSVKAEGVLVPKAAVQSRYENPRVQTADGKTVNLLVLGESGDYLLAAEDPRLPVGAKLAPAGNP